MRQAGSTTQVAHKLWRHLGGNGQNRKVSHEMKWLTVIAVLVGVACIFAYRQHYRVITFGQFQFLEIGMGKQDVIDRLIANKVSAVESDFIHPAINPRTPDPSEQFKVLSRYVVKRIGTLWVIKIVNGEIAEIDKGFDSGGLEGYFSVGDTREKFLQRASDAVRDLGYTVIGHESGYGPENHTGISLMRDARSSDMFEQGLEWIKSRERWRFRSPTGYAVFKLEFESEALSKIEYTNYFMELP